MSSVHPHDEVDASGRPEAVSDAVSDATGPSPVAEDTPRLRIRLDRHGDPRLSASFVLRRTPRTDDRLSDLVERATMAIDVDVSQSASVGEERPLLVDRLRLELRSPDGDLLAERTTTGPFASSAVDVTVFDEAAGGLLRAVAAGEPGYRLIADVEAATPSTFDTTGSTGSMVRVRLDQAWSFLDAVAGDDRRFFGIDLVNYLPQLLATGAVVAPDGAAALDVVRAIMQAAPTVLVPKADVVDGSESSLGAPVTLSAEPPPRMTATARLRDDATTRQVRVVADLGELVHPLVVGEPSRYVHLVALDGGDVSTLLPVRRTRRARSREPMALSAMHVATGTNFVSLHSAIEPEPMALSAVILPHLIDTSALEHLAVTTDLEFDVGGDRRPGPVVSDLGRPSWPDRFDDDRQWYVPRFEFVVPDPSAAVDDGSPFHVDIEPDGGHDLAGNVGITATVTATLRVVAPDDAPDGSSQVPVTGGVVHLAIPFRDEDGTTRTELARAEGDPLAAVRLDVGSTVTVRFRLLDNWARLAYGALSTAGFQAEPARVVVTLAFEGWRTVRDAPPVTGLTKRRQLLAGPTDGAPVTTRAGRPAGFSDVSTLGASATLHHLAVAETTITPAWHIRPEILSELLLANVRHEWSEHAVTRTVDVHVDCASTPQAYRERRPDGGWNTIGCRPALQLGQTEYRTYEPIDVEAADGWATVLRSLRSPGRFLVVADRHVVGRHDPGSERAYRPALLLHSTIDVDDPSNLRCVLAASLQPDLPAFVRDAIVAELRATAHPEPELESLAECGVAADLAWAAPGRTDIESVQVRGGFEVVCTADPAGFLVLRSLLGRSGIRGVASIELPGRVRISTELLLSLSDVTGPFDGGPIELTPTPGGRLRLTNRTGQRIAVRSVTSNGVTVAEVSDVLDPDEVIEIDHPDAPWPLYVDHRPESGSEVLDEVRAYIEDLDVALVFVATSDPADHDLVALEVATRLGDLEPDPLILTTTDRQIEQSFMLPLTDFVDRPELTFSVTAVGNDGTRTTGPTVSWDLGTDGALVPIAPPDG